MFSSKTSNIKYKSKESVYNSFLGINELFVRVIFMEVYYQVNRLLLGLYEMWSFMKKKPKLKDSRFYVSNSTYFQHGTMYIYLFPNEHSKINGYV